VSVGLKKSFRDEDEILLLLEKKKA
jgi:hypothetical protein